MNKEYLAALSSTQPAAAVKQAGAHYVWFFSDASAASKELQVVWDQAKIKYKNLGYTQYDYQRYKQLADGIGCTEAPSFAFWYLTKLSFISTKPTPQELDDLLRVWNFS